MKIKVIQIFATLLILSSINISCKRFDSNRVNNELIQGVWKQVKIAYLNESGNAVVEEPADGLTTLTFEGEQCLEEMADVNRKSLYSFKIHDYILTLAQVEKEINYLEISKLTADSLVLRGKNMTWKYKKKAD